MPSLLFHRMIFHLPSMAQVSRKASMMYTLLHKTYIINLLCMKTHTHTHRQHYFSNVFLPFQPLFFYKSIEWASVCVWVFVCVWETLCSSANAWLIPSMAIMDISSPHECEIESCDIGQGFQKVIWTNVTGSSWSSVQCGPESLALAPGSKSEHGRKEDALVDKLHKGRAQVVHSSTHKLLS